MSYILDALKKSEKERKRGNIPDLSNTPEPPTNKPKKRTVLPYLIGIILLINAGLLFWWLVPREEQEQMSVAQRTDKGEIQKQTEMIRVSGSKEGFEEIKVQIKPEKAKQEDKNPAENSQRMRPERSEREIVEKTQPLARITLPGNDELEGHETITPPVPIDIEQADQGNIMSQQTEIEQYTSDKSSAVEPQQNREPTPVKGRLYKKSELPISLQQELPDFRISMALYSEDPNSRVAKINGKTLKEGQFLEEGLKLEEIKPDGVVFHYRNYSFQINLR